MLLKQQRRAISDWHIRDAQGADTATACATAPCRPGAKDKDVVKKPMRKNGTLIEVRKQG